MRHLYWNYRLSIPIKNFSKVSLMILTNSSNFFPNILILAFCLDLNFWNLKDFLISKLNMVFKFQISLHYSFIFWRQSTISFLQNNALNVKARYDWTYFNLLQNHPYFFFPLLKILISWYYFGAIFPRLHLYLEFELWAFYLCMNYIL